MGKNNLRNTKRTDTLPAPEGQRPIHSVRLPGFLIDEGDGIGLGDVIKRVTNTMGIRHCGGCEKRATLLNQWVRFSR
jgi:hypothetical protein